MKKIVFSGLGIILCILTVFIVVALVNRRATGVSEPTLSGSRLAAVDEVEIKRTDGAFLRLDRDAAGRWQAVSEQGCFEPEAARIDDLLSVFNLWEIAFIPTDSQASVWRKTIAEEGGEIRLRTKRKTLLKLHFANKDNLFVVRTGRQCYAMRSPWQTASWVRLFDVDAENWKSRSVLDLDYTQVEKVRLIYEDADTLSYDFERFMDSFFCVSGAEGQQDTVDAAVARAYLAAFKGVYFDMPASGAKLGKPLYRIEVKAKDGRTFDMWVYEKQTENGMSDLFKAMVLLPAQSSTDTVELSYAVLDKMAKTRLWFLSR